ncbi:MAG TPA: imelysin family protein, partial [Hyphomicrobiales bacterium]|nr:imelysin family protein [Hyphomicrobiales bacterium]
MRSPAGSAIRWGAGTLALAAGLGLAATAQSAEPSAVLATYADIAAAGYGDSVTAATALEAAVDALVAAPSEATLAAARKAWLAARVPYQQTEVYRFGNAIVDDWEGRVNAWPLDEGLIDYVDAGYYGTQSDENEFYTVNVIANTKLMVGGKEIDATAITPELLSGTLHEAGGIEANVATGYHAVEFLLWGQDLNGTGPGAGARPATDFDPAACTGGACERRAAYLKAATSLLVADLREMAESWGADGEARKAALAGSEAEGLARMLTGMGSLSYGELAGERMKLGLILHDPEEEHDCFSDNTHASHYFDVAGIRNVYLGRYARIDGSAVEGPSLSDLVAARDSAIDAELKGKLDTTVAAMQALVDRAAAGEAYDQLIGEGNAAGNALVQAAIDALIDQTRNTDVWSETPVV